MVEEKKLSMYKEKKEHPLDFGKVGPYKPVRKSAFMNFTKCPMQFNFMYNDKSYWDYATGDHVNKSTLYGEIYHNLMDEFFAKIDVPRAHELNSKDLCAYFRGMFPTDTPLDSWFDWTARLETKRFEMYKKDYGLEGLQKWWIPHAVELKIDMKDEIDRTGHVDRIDFLPEYDCYAVVEYKTGPSYNRNKKWVMSSIRKETGFYAIILNSLNILPKPVKYFILINPATEQFTVEKFHHATLSSVNKKYKDLVDRIKNDGPWPKVHSVLCRHCKFRMECFYGSKDYPETLIFGRGPEPL